MIIITLCKKKSKNADVGLKKQRVTRERNVKRGKLM